MQSAHFQSNIREYLLWTAASVGNLPKATQLLSDPTLQVNLGHGTFNSTPFFRACRSGATDIVREFLKRADVDINQGNDDGAASLVVACEGPTEIVDMLLADPRIIVSCKDRIGTSPFLTACAKGSQLTIQALLRDPRVDPYELMLDGQGAVSLLLEIDQVVGLLTLIAFLPTLGPESLIDTELSQTLGLPEDWNELLQSLNTPFLRPRDLALAKNCPRAVQVMDDFLSKPTEVRFNAWRTLGLQGQRGLSRCFELSLFLFWVLLVVSDK